MIMNMNMLITALTRVSYRLTSGSIPLTLNGQPINIIDATLEGSNGNYWCDLKTEESLSEDFEQTIKGLLFDAGDKYNLDTDLDKATKDLAPRFLEAAKKQLNST